MKDDFDDIAREGIIQEACDSGSCASAGKMDVWKGFEDNSLESEP